MGGPGSGRNKIKRIRLDYGKYIKVLRDNDIRTIRALSDALDTPKSTIQNWERDGWPVNEYNRLRVLLGLNDNMESAKALQEKVQNESDIF